MVFVGPSGCGKSTLLRMIAGLEDATSGDIVIDNEVVNTVSAADRGCAMVFQSYALYPHMSVYANMAFGLENMGMRKDLIHDKVTATAKLLRLDPLLDRRPTQLSGGQRQRVAIGRAIVREPKIFLFDEPLSNLDAELRVSMRSELRELHHRLGATMIYVTHDQVEAMTLAQRMIVMNGGVMEQFGTPEEVYNRPASTFVASFIGSPPMNLLKQAPGLEAGQILGIRPEHLELSSSGWAMKVDTVELLGAERLVHAHLGGETLTLRLDASLTAPSAGQTFHATPKEGCLHHFNAETGKRL